MTFIQAPVNFDGAEKRPSSPMNRSQTDSNISYPYEELPEAAGASHFVNREGGFDFQVILEVMRFIFPRASLFDLDLLSLGHPFRHHSVRYLLR